MCFVAFCPWRNEQQTLEAGRFHRVVTVIMFFADIVVFGPWGCEHIPLPAERAPFQSPLLRFKYFCMEIGQYFPHLKPRVTACLLTYEETWPWEERLHESFWSISKNRLVHYQMEIWDICRTKWKWLLLFSPLLLIIKIYKNGLCFFFLLWTKCYVIRVKMLLFFLC